LLGALPRRCLGRRPVQLLLSFFKLFVQPALDPRTDVFLERSDDGPKKAVDRRYVEELLVANIGLDLASRNLRVRDASNALATPAKPLAAGSPKMVKRLDEGGSFSGASTGHHGEALQRGSV
jgi:hypothetical protein